MAVVPRPVDAQAGPDALRLDAGVRIVAPGPAAAVGEYLRDELRALGVGEGPSLVALELIGAARGPDALGDLGDLGALGALGGEAYELRSKAMD